MMYLIYGEEYRQDAFYPVEYEVAYCTSKEVAEAYCEERNRFRQFAPHMDRYWFKEVDGPRFIEKVETRPMVLRAMVTYDIFDKEWHKPFFTEELGTPTEVSVAKTCLNAVDVRFSITPYEGESKESLCERALAFAKECLAKNPIELA